MKETPLGWRGTTPAASDSPLDLSRGELAVPRITLLIGVLLAFVGIAFFLYTNSEHPTALIPAGFGAVFVLLGLLSAVEHLRKHMMHAAAALSLIGCVLGVVRLIPGPQKGRETAFVETAILAGLCSLLLILCVMSFINARRRRRAQQLSS